MWAAEDVMGIKATPPSPLVDLKHAADRMSDTAELLREGEITAEQAADFLEVSAARYRATVALAAPGLEPAPDASVLVGRGPFPHARIDEPNEVKS